LGGYHNFESDRQVVRTLLQHYPELPAAAAVNRAFLRRAVTYLVDQGIDQFLDIGSGLPTLGNVHEVAQALNPVASVVYVDIDPVAVAHSQAILEDNARAGAIQADLRLPRQVLASPVVARLLDLDRPLALMLVAVLHYVLDDKEAQEAMANYLEALPGGSYVAISHTSRELESEQGRQRRHQFGPVGNTRSRTRDELLGFLTGLELVDPGIVYTPLWRPSIGEPQYLQNPQRAFTWAVVARKPR
jgi:hypothetical protein